MSDNSLNGDEPLAAARGPATPEVPPPETSSSIDVTANPLFSEAEPAGIAIHASLAQKVGFAMQQNDVPALTALVIRNETTEALEQLTLNMRAEPAILGARQWTIDRVAAGGELHLRDRSVSLAGGLLADLTERMRAEVTFELRRGDALLARAVHPVTALARNEWGGASTMPELLAAFVCPNEQAVARVLKDAARALESAGKKPSMEGYQQKSRQRVWEIAAAVWSAIASRRLTYAEPPASFESNGQKIRLPAEIDSTGLATCLDTTLLFAAALEQAGLNAVVAFTRGHAFCGVWLQPQTFPSLTVDEASELRKAIAQQELLLLETTLVTAGNSVTFSQAAREAGRQIAEEVEDQFIYALDIRQARGRQITPLADFERAKRASEDADVASGLPPLDTAPELPGFDFGLEEAALPDTPTGRIEAWKRQLLDLSKRNRLLNLKPSSSVIPIFCPDAPLLEDMLADGKKMSFTSPPQPSDSDRDATLHLFRTGDNLAEQHARDALQRGELIANVDPRALEAALVNLFRKARSDLEEGGANTLFLALGMLKWRPNGETRLSYRAPLVMIPVRLERKSVKAPLKLLRHDDDAVFNMTLLQMLRSEFAIDIPMLEGELPQDDAGVDVKKCWDAVRVKVRDTPGFEVTEELCLSTFSFAKFLMWKDLADRTDALKASPFVRHMIDSPREPYQGGARFLSPREIDTQLSPADIFAPFNADSSQIVAIHASGQDNDFVIEGPPGTGKSETICNIIAHNLALGRRVLFVAEKMAALDVVRRRMDERGLGRFCLDLHANHANKKAVIDQLRVSWDGAGQQTVADWQTRAQELARVRDALNTLVEALHAKGRTGVSAREAIGRTIRYAERHALELDWGPDPVGDDRARDVAGLAALETLAHRLGQTFGELTAEDQQLFAPVTQHEWSNAWVAELREIAASLALHTRAVREAGQRFCAALGLPAADESAETLSMLAGLATAVQQAGPARVGFALEAEGRDALDALDMSLKALEAYRQARGGRFAAVPDERIVDAPVDAWNEAHAAAEERMWPMRVFARSRLRKTIAAPLGIASGKDTAADITQLAQARERYRRMEAHARELPDGTPWRGLETDITAAREILAKGRALREAVTCVAMPGLDAVAARMALRRVFVEGREALEAGMPIARAIAEFLQTHQTFAQSREVFDSRAGCGERPLDLLAIEALCHAVQERAARLKSWCAWVQARKEAEANGLARLTEALAAGVIAPTDAREAFRTAYRRWLAPRLIDAAPELRTFSSVAHEDLIRTFRRLDKELADTTASYIAAHLSAQVPSSQTVALSSGYGVLRREIAKKTRHKPVRNLIAEMGNDLLTLTPCVMMSPLSVAQFLPAHAAPFDLVIFDEASQITVADAIGTIARGKRVVVVGDPKQMPPTSFFDKAAAEADEGDDEAADLESILDEALAAAVPLHRLTGHYRSRHESLIAFSNHTYYEGSLVTYPSSDTRDSAVTLRRINGVYARGKTRTNPEEAKAVVEEVLRRLRDPVLAQLSIGVVTLNSQQQQLILNLLDQAIRAEPDLAAYFNQDDPDHVFVKNLETVQGDQRDVILLSVTFGPTDPGGLTMSMNFGPLNKSGGERRLNVAITRATTEVLVFASFDAGMVDTNRTSAQAVADLKNYLDFATRGPVALGEAIVSIGGGAAYESDFEMAVAEGLRRCGWDVRTQIGVSRFRIDLGIVHPDSPGRFLAGVECDGATYHSSPSARDRDRVRHAILERLGWRLLRVWSTDWFIDPRERLQVLDDALKALLAADRAESQRQAQAAAQAPSPTAAIPGAAAESAGSADGGGVDADDLEDNGVVADVADVAADSNDAGDADADDVPDADGDSDDAVDQE
jgi:very-short-patch-repair endonuclease